jgi:dTDP-4-dehydrorhamnose reductase
VSAAGLKTIILPTTTDRFPRPAKRPKYSVLSASSLDHYGVRMPDWQDALRRYLIERNPT